MTCKACEKMRELLYEVMMWHREAGNSQYHQCEQSICNWCVDAQKAIDMRCECRDWPPPVHDVNEFYEEKGGDASCPVTTPLSTGAGQSNPEPAPTPRTDAACVTLYGGSIVDAGFARQLERELAAARTCITYKEREELYEHRENEAAREVTQPRWHPYDTDPPKEEDGTM